MVYNRTLNDSVSTSDAITLIREYNRNVNDSVSTSDGISSQKVYTRVLVDSVSTSDSANTQKAIGRSLNDNVTTVDAIIVQKYFIRLFNETNSTSDVANRIFKTLRFPVDSQIELDSVLGMRISSIEPPFINTPTNSPCTFTIQGFILPDTNISYNKVMVVINDDTVAAGFKQTLNKTPLGD